MNVATLLKSLLVNPKSECNLKSRENTISHYSAKASQAMATYIVGQLRVKHWKWYQEYQAVTESLVAKHGGEYIVKSPDVCQVEGEGAAPDAVVVIRFPDAASADSWYRDSAYSPMIELRRSNEVETQLLLIKDA